MLYLPASCRRTNVAPVNAETLNVFIDITPYSETIISILDIPPISRKYTNNILPIIILNQFDSSEKPFEDPNDPHNWKNKA